jgi:putative transposase
MAEQARGKRVHERWAHFRFSVVGQLLAAPPGKGELAAAIAALADRTWHHPITDEHTRFGFSTIERWYYRASKERSDPVGVLRRKLRVDAGRQSAISGAVRQALQRTRGGTCPTKHARPRALPRRERAPPSSTVSN